MPWPSRGSAAVRPLVRSPWAARYISTRRRDVPTRHQRPPPLGDGGPQELSACCDRQWVGRFRERHYYPVGSEDSGGCVTSIVTGAEAPPTFAGPAVILARNCLTPVFPNVHPNWNVELALTERTSTVCQSLSAPSFWR